MSNRRVRIGIVGIGLAMLGWAETADAEVAACQSKTGTFDRYNVILFLLDDVSAADIPFFNPAIQWSRSATSTANVNDGVMMAEAKMRHPDYNRMAARLAAQLHKDCGGDGTCDLGTNFLHPDSDPYTDPNVTPSQSTTVRERRVVPLEGREDAASSYFLERIGAPSTPTRTENNDILTQHGGMRWVAEQGVVFPRFYATSGRCTPTRASILTGLHPRQVGITDNGNQINPDEVTIADFLKNLCDDGDSATPCYATGVIGKWHVGASEKGSANTPWQRGFDEAIYYPDGSRAPWESGPLRCSPPVAASFQRAGPGSSMTVTQTEEQRGFFCVGNETVPSTPNACLSNADCGVGGKCRAWGTYLGRKGSAVSGRQLVCPPSKANADPNCCAHPLGDVALPLKADGTPKTSSISIENSYQFATKQLSLGENFWLSEDEPGGENVCDDDRHYEDKAGLGNPVVVRGCRYDTRFFRDMATNFVSRHQNERFFLEVAFHSQHSVSDAPLLTRQHHSIPNPKPSLPDDADKYWASMEEVDAAIGDVMSTLEGVCSLDSTHPGKKCTTSNAATECGGTCNTSLQAQTIVLITSDQGRPSSGYGAPIFRGSKGSTFEGGVGVGLIGKLGKAGTGVGGNGKATAATFANTMLDDRYVGSQVDIFATIADAAGCAPGFGSGNADYGFGVLTKGKGKFCIPPSNGAACTAGSQPCCTRVLPGRSLLPYLKGATGSAPPSTARKEVLATFHGSPKSLISAQVDPAVAPWASSSTVPTGYGICGVEVTDAADDGSGSPDPNPTKIDLIRHAGSCETCTSDSNCRATSESDPNSAKKCVSGETYCVTTEAQRTACSLDGSLTAVACDWRKFSRCSPATSCSGTCMHVEIPCETCFVTPQWKLMATGGGAGNGYAVSPSALFDLKTNPEEGNPQYKVGGGVKRYPLNCIEKANVTGTPFAADATLDRMCRRISSWEQCRRSGDLSKNCETVTGAGATCLP